MKPVDLAKEENKEAAYAALSLTRRVPTLAIGEFQLRSLRRSPNTWKTSTRPTPFIRAT